MANVPPTARSAPAAVATVGRLLGGRSIAAMATAAGTHALPADVGR